MSAWVDVFLQFFYQSWIYILVAAVGCLVLIGAAGALWYLYFSDQSYKNQVRLHKNAKNKTVDDVKSSPTTGEEDEMPPYPQNLASERQTQRTINEELPPPAPGLLVPSRRDSETGSLVSHILDEDGLLVRDINVETLLSRTTTLEKLRSNTLERHRTNAEMPPPPAHTTSYPVAHHPAEVQHYPDDVMLYRVQNNHSMSAPGVAAPEQMVSVYTGRKKSKKKLPAPWRTHESSTAVPFKSCDSFVYNQWPSRSRDSVGQRDISLSRDSIGQRDIPLSRDALNPRDITRSRDALSPRDITRSRDALSPRDITRSRDALSPRDIARSRDALSPRDIARSRDALNPRDIARSRDALSQRDIARSRDALSPRDIASSRDALNPRDIARSRDVLFVDESSSPNSVASRHSPTYVEMKNGRLLRSNSDLHDNRYRKEIEYRKRKHSIQLNIEDSRNSSKHSETNLAHSKAVNRSKSLSEKLRHDLISRDVDLHRDDYLDQALSEQDESIVYTNKNSGQYPIIKQHKSHTPELSSSSSEESEVIECHDYRMSYDRHDIASILRRDHLALSRGNVGTSGTLYESGETTDDEFMAPTIYENQDIQIG